jgi:transcriptional/translational regulatory protein YebC/TACO1
MFEKKGTITISKEDIDEDIILEKSLDLGAEDFYTENDTFIITTNPDAFGVISKGLEEEGYEINGELGLIPINSVKVSGLDAKQLIDLLERLEEHEDVQKVYSNFDFDESEITSLL